MKTRGFLICFTGVDGSGKTTLSIELVKLLNSNRIKCRYVYGRLEPFILKPFMIIGRKIFLREKDMFNDYTEYSNTKKKAIKSNPFLSKVYQLILLFDYSLQLLFRIRLPLIFGKNIVCDRYVYDTVITDLSVDMDYSGHEIKKLLKKCFYIALKPDIAFLIDVPEEVAFQRKDDTPSIEYLKERRRVYLKIGEEYNMMLLDGSKDLTELKELVQREAFEYMKRGDIK